MGGVISGAVLTLSPDLNRPLHGHSGLARVVRVADLPCGAARRSCPRRAPAPQLRLGALVQSHALVGSRSTLWACEVSGHVL